MKSFVFFFGLSVNSQGSLWAKRTFYLYSNLGHFISDVGMFSFSLSHSHAHILLTECINLGYLLEHDFEHRLWNFVKLS